MTFKCYCTQLKQILHTLVTFKLLKDQDSNISKQQRGILCHSMTRLPLTEGKAQLPLSPPLHKISRSP